MLTLNSAPADVVTAKAAVPADIAHQGVSALLRFSDGVTQRGSAEHPAAAGQHAIVISESGTGVEDLAVSRFFQRQAVDLITGTVVARIATGGDHHAQRGAFVPLGGFLIQLAVAGGEAQIYQIRFHAQHDRLGFRIAKAAVELDNLRVSLFIDHQARIEETGVGVPFRCHTFYGWPDNAFHGALVNLIGYHRRR